MGLTTDQIRLVQHAIDAWVERDELVEKLKNDHVVPYFWIKYNDINRDFYPLRKLKALL